jgi:hypothetical protein
LRATEEDDVGSICCIGTLNCGGKGLFVHILLEPGA